MFGKKEGKIKQNYEKGWWMALVWVAPSFILFAMFCYYPFIKTIINSFAITSQLGEFIKWAGLKNWIRVFTDEDFGQMMANTFVFAIQNFVLTFFPAMFFALLSTRQEKGSKLYQTLYAVPMAIAATTVAAIWMFIYRQNNGILNQVLGTDINWLRNTETALFCVALVTSWSHIAGRYIYLMVGFRNVSDDLIEASMIDGAGWWTRTVKIMIPMASPQIFFVLFTSIVSAFKTFTQIKLLTGAGIGGSTNTLMYSVYSKYNAGQISISCCVALILFVIIFIATRIQFAFEKKTVFYQ